jgi:PIN domain nuclease of toxin-antitoxin system
MIYVVDTHIFVWFLDKDKRLKPKYYQILSDKSNNFVFPAIVLAEIKYLIYIKRIKVDFENVLRYLGESENCIIYPLDEDVIQQMPKELNIHNALIVATGLVYKNILKEEVKILTEDSEIVKSKILKVA